MYQLFTRCSVYSIWRITLVSECRMSDIAVRYLINRNEEIVLLTLNYKAMDQWFISYLSMCSINEQNTSLIFEMVHPHFRRQKNFLPPLAGLIPYCRKKEFLNRKRGGMKFFVGENGRTPIQRLSYVNCHRKPH